MVRCWQRGTSVCWRHFSGRLFGVSFTGAPASFNDKIVVQRQTTPPKKPDNMAPNTQSALLSLMSHDCFMFILQADQCVKYFCRPFASSTNISPIDRPNTQSALLSLMSHDCFMFILQADQCVKYFCRPFASSTNCSSICASSCTGCGSVGFWIL